MGQVSFAMVSFKLFKLSMLGHKVAYRAVLFRPWPRHPLKPAEVGKLDLVIKLAYECVWWVWPP